MLTLILTSPLNVMDLQATETQNVEADQQSDYVLHSDAAMVCSLLDSLYDASPLVRYVY